MSRAVSLDMDSWSRRVGDGDDLAPACGARDGEAAGGAGGWEAGDVSTDESDHEGMPWTAAHAHFAHAYHCGGFVVGSLPSYWPSLILYGEAAGGAGGREAGDVSTDESDHEGLPWAAAHAAFLAAGFIEMIGLCLSCAHGFVSAVNPIHLTPDGVPDTPCDECGGVISWSRV